MPNIDMDAYEDDWEDHDVLRPSKRTISAEAKAKNDTYDVSRVVAVDRGRLMLLLDGEVVPGRFGGAMRGTKAIVGDRVRAKPPRHEQDVARIVDLLERETELVRTGDDAEDDTRVLVANAEQVIIVVAANYLTGGSGFAERALISASWGGLTPIVCINKLDLIAGHEDEVAALEARYEAIGITVLRTSAETGVGVDTLRDQLAGRWSAFTGHSGVGKSSLFNHLVPEEAQAVGELGRFGGRHTTVSSRAHPVPDVAGAWLVDTPGVRSWGLGHVAPEDLADHYREFAAASCHLEDCVHDGEPGCQVASGEVAIAPERLASYRRILANLRDGDRDGGREPVDTGTGP